MCEGVGATCGVSERLSCREMASGAKVAVGCGDSATVGAGVARGAGSGVGVSVSVGLGGSRLFEGVFAPAMTFPQDLIRGRRK
jgi:hypothetical protein